MGLFGPSQPEKIRRSASEAFPQADWKVDVDWSSGSKLHNLRGSRSAQHTEAENLQLARDVWLAVTRKFRLHPDDAFDGLLNVSVASPGCCDQSTGTLGG